MFENHKHKKSFIQDLRQTAKINKFSTESQDLIADMNNTEIFELCENSSKQQCPDCNACWEMGIICCSCGRNMQSTRVQRSSTRTIVTSPQSLDTWSRKTAAVELSTELLKDKRCTTRRNRCFKSPIGKARKPSDDTFTMVRRSKLQKVIVGQRVARTPHNIVRQDRPGEAHLHRYKSWKN